MTKDIPEIDELLDGINDPDLPLQTEESKESPTTVEPNIPITMQGELEKLWTDFMANLSSTEQKQEKDERLVCKLDRDLADSLDDCDIYSRSRSDMVNAIVRAFFGMYLPRLAQYRKEKKSLFTNFKEK